jgi:hypothetical protein
MEQVSRHVDVVASPDVQDDGNAATDVRQQLRTSWGVLEQRQVVLHRMHQRLCKAQAAVDHSRRRVKATRELLNSFDVLRTRPRGDGHGRDQQDWFEAGRELSKEGQKL